MMAPIDTPERASIFKSRYGWTIIAFVLAGLLVSGLVIWQLYETSPRIWCQIAEGDAEAVRGACLAILLKLLDLKDHAVIGLLTILGITVVSLVAVALGLKISAGGPGNTHVDIGADETRIESSGADVTIPTPPSEKRG